METRQLLRLDYDYDADGTVDVRTYMRAGRPFRLEGDTNRDGLADRWEYYDGKAQLERIGGSTLGDGREDSWAYPSAVGLRLEIATQRDGFVDRREFYESNRLTRTESDTNHDSRPDLWEEYEAGALKTVLVDDDKRHGRATRRVIYAPGATPRVETDLDGDGHFIVAATSNTE